MSWYYKDGDQEIGPVSKEDLQGLIKARQISGRTLVRSASGSQWRPLADMVRRKAPDPAPPPATAAAAEAAAAAGPATTPAPQPAPPAAPSAVCSQCGRSFPEDQVVMFDDQVICAACKPMFVQRLKEGVSVGGSFKYGGFWIRFGAKIIDGIVLYIAQQAILIPLSFLSFSSVNALDGSPENFTGFLMMIGVQNAVALLIPAVYSIFFVGRFGATPGKMACRLKIVTPEGEPLSYWRAAGRHLAEYVNIFTLMVGYLMAGFDKEKRALHDRIASTRVVYR